MSKILTRMTHWGAAIVVLSQASVLGGEAQPLPVVEPVATVAETSPPETLVPEPLVTEGKTQGLPAGMPAGIVEVLPVSKPRPLFQHATYPAAWKAAQQSNRPILVFVSMPNCHYCVKMKEQVYHLHHVKQLVTSSFETLQVGRFSHAELVQKLHIKWYPTTVLVGPNNKILDVIEGYADANQFQRRLQTGLASLHTSTTTQTR